jgi:hypothetical protein
MIIVAIFLIIIGFAKIVVSRKTSDLKIPPEYSSLLDKDKLTMIAEGVVICESLLEILAGIYIIYAN